MVSVIVTTFNSAGCVESCLRSIRASTYPDIEIILVDNNSLDETKNIATEFCDQLFNIGPERSAQRNFGVKKARGEYVLILDSDMILTPKVVEESVAEMEKSGRKAVIIPERSIGRSFWAECKSLERSYYVGLDWMEGARFFRRRTFLAIGGYETKNTGTEDFDLPQRIKSKFGEKAVGRVEDCILHNEANLSLIQSCQKKFYYARHLNYYLENPANKAVFKIQASLFQRFKLFFSQPKKLLGQPIVAAGLMVLKTAEFFSGGVGFLSADPWRGIKLIKEKIVPDKKRF